MSSTSRKNRWGSNSGQHARLSNNGAQNSSSADEEALRALLSSAEAREQERDGKNDNKRSRFDRDGYNNSKRQRGEGSQDMNRNSNYRSGRHGHDRRHGEDSRRSNRDHHQRQDRRGGGRDDNSYYGPAKVEDDDDRQDRNVDKEGTSKDSEGTEAKVEVAKPNFGLSGALTKDEGGGGNVYKGVVLKFKEPPEARAPNTQWRLYVFKGKELLQTLHISKQSAYLIGRNQEIADIPVQHPSLSGQHAVLQYRALPTKHDPLKVACQPYIMDFSTNGTFLNTVRIDSARYYQLKKGDVLKFGGSTREYVLMTENTTSVR